MPKFRQASCKIKKLTSKVRLRGAMDELPERQCRHFFTSHENLNLLVTSIEEVMPKTFHLQSCGVLVATITVICHSMAKDRDHTKPNHFGCLGTSHLALSAAFIVAEVRDNV